MYGSGVTGEVLGKGGGEEVKKRKWKKMVLERGRE